MEYLKTPRRRQYYEDQIPEKDRLYSHPEPFRRYAHQLRMKWITKLLFETRKHFYFVDVGCGANPYFPSTAKYFSFSVGLDIATSKVQKLKEMVKEQSQKDDNVDFIVADVQSLPFRDEVFSMLLCSEVLEHLPHPSLAINEISRITAGEAIISVPGLGTFPGYIYKYVFKKTFIEGEHIQFFYPKDLLSNIKNAGFQVTDIIGSGNTIFFSGEFMIRRIFNVFPRFRIFLEMLDNKLNKTRILNFLGLHLILKCVKIPFKCEE